MPEVVLRDRSGHALLEISDDGLTLNVVTVSGLALPVYTVTNLSGGPTPAQVASVLLNRAGQITQRLSNDSDDPTAYAEFNVGCGSTPAIHRANGYFGANGLLSSDPTSAGRAYFAANNQAAANEGFDFFATLATGRTTPKHRFYSNGLGAAQLRVQIDDNGLSVFNSLRNFRSVGLTAANANLLTVAVGAVDATFECDANVLVTAAGTHSFQVNLTYTDEGNTSRTIRFNLQGHVAGTPLITDTIANANGAIPYAATSQRVRAKAGTNLVFATSGTFTSVTYNAEGGARMLSL